MLRQDELRAIAAAFGVSDRQVQRDHMISHVLHAMAEIDPVVTFFGGTALARTHLIDPAGGSRLSEDIDLYSPQRVAMAALLDGQLPGRMRREFPGVRWEPALSEVSSTRAAQLVSREGLRVRVQLLDSAGAHHHEICTISHGWPGWAPSAGRLRSSCTMPPGGEWLRICSIGCRPLIGRDN